MPQITNEAVQVKELAARYGVAPDVIRYYSRIGLLHPQRAANGYRVYGPRDQRNLRFIIRAKRLGYTLREIKVLLDEAQKGRSPCPSARRILESRVRKNRRQLDELMKLQNRIEQALGVWETLPDRLPDGDAVCHLIEQNLLSE
ncbi:MAG: MerR family transcriptional regulator [Pseudomonadota bacterium]|nr:MerR family transcriptional regulator [Pseudomonadota bacterium]